jgi:hypothetical protein
MKQANIWVGDEWETFKKNCKKIDMNYSQVVRRLVREFNGRSSV